MKVSCSTLLFGGLPLPDALRRMAVLGFERAELSVHYKPAWGHVLPEMVQNEPDNVSAMVREAIGESGVKITAIAAHFDPLAQSERGQFSAVCSLAGELGIPLVSVIANQPSELIAANSMKDHVAIAGRSGISLAVELHRPSVVADPQSAMRLIEQVRGLYLTLDTGHLLSNGYPKEEWLPLFPHVKHVHVKDSGGAMDLVQMKVGEGLLDVGFLVGNLTEAGYGGELVVEYMGPRDRLEGFMDYEKESVRMREVLESALLDSGTAS